jgi:hypothetical protein
MKKSTFGAIVAALFASAGIASRSEADITVNFANKTFAGFAFDQFVDYSTGNVVGTLTSVSVNATLNASVSYTYADDLTVYVDVEPLNSGGLLQVGGFSNLSAAQRYGWANGGSDVVGTVVNDTKTLTSPITFTGNKSVDGTVFFGNGYGASGTSGTWTGSLTLAGVNFVPLGGGGAAVPEPGSMGFVAACGIGALMRRRRQKLAAKVR